MSVAHLTDETKEYRSLCDQAGVVAERRYGGVLDLLPTGSRKQDTLGESFKQAE
jgi:hypothetical protein